MIINLKCCQLLIFLFLSIISLNNAKENQYTEIDDTDLILLVLKNLHSLVEQNQILSEKIEKLNIRIDLLQQNCSGNSNICDNAKEQTISIATENLVSTVNTNPTSAKATISLNPIIIDNVMVNSINFGNNWQLIQQRKNDKENFYRNWLDYKNGFGHASENVFIGLQKLYEITSSGRCELLILLKDFDNNLRYAHYDHFELGNESKNFYLKQLGHYNGTAGDSLSYHKGAKFSTFDRDNDDELGVNCAKKFTGAWWYRSCDHSNLNGRYFTNELTGSNIGYASGIHWRTFRGQWYSLKFVQILIRTKNK